MRIKQTLIYTAILGLLIFSGSALLSKILYFNPSISEPRGYYLVDFRKQIFRKDHILVCITDKLRVDTLYALGFPRAKSVCKDDAPMLLKEVVGISGDTISVAATGISVNGRLLAYSAPLESASATKSAVIKLSPEKYGTYILKSGEYWVMGQTPHSYDSRYFGVVTESQIYARAKFILALGYRLW